MVSSFPRTSIAALALVGLIPIALSSPAAHAQTLSGATIYGTDSTGSPVADGWNTAGGDATYNLWVSLNGVALNGPADAQAAISASLALPGTYNFTIYGQPGANVPYNGLNLFFDGNNGTPGISVLAPLATSAFTPAFSVNSNPSTFTVLNTFVPGAGTTTFFSGGKRITLTDFRWESSTYQNQDLVSAFTRTPGGGADEQGRFTLQVTAAPEPSSLLLSMVGGMLTSGFFFYRKAVQRAA